MTPALPDPAPNEPAEETGRDDAHREFDVGSRDGRLWETDTGTLAESSRRAFAALVKGPYLSADRQKEAWRALLTDTQSIRSRLADLFLDLVVDEVQGVAFVRNAESTEKDLPQVVRTMALTFMDTALLLFLRRELVRGAGPRRVFIGRDEVYEHLHSYRGAESTDEAGFAKRINSSWKKFETHNLLLRTPTEGRFEVSPVLRLVFGPEQIAAVTAEYQRLIAAGDDGADPETGTDTEMDEAGADAVLDGEKE
ncbi:DUF4194 domain-containing protein [Zhihengliuella salsuginis]|uniref:DUF4194 domain-containing protein n=1 Tax=Zhihengliuella salsuginis TaxID=578222 RepID=A0ABQ3GGW7_9MICC|nr:DUF4194 domain-containing protein [Zhihengliuella salsuginis]GHD05730.1 hypothetical protein GCM10008096_15060 [Zhihengliuella salsuginis]